MTARRFRLLLANAAGAGDAAARRLARTLRNAGVEVIYLDLQERPEIVVNVAVQEDVDAVGVTGEPATDGELCGRIRALLRTTGLEHLPLLNGAALSAGRLGGSGGTRRADAARAPAALQIAELVKKNV